MATATKRSAHLDSRFHSWFSVVVYAVLLLIALKPLIALWNSAVGDGWLRFEIVSPWLWVVLLGFELVVSARQALLRPREASSVMIGLGIIVMFVYNAMFHLKFGH